MEDFADRQYGAYVYQYGALARLPLKKAQFMFSLLLARQPIMRTRLARAS
jgi:hypothetical protein